MQTLYITDLDGTLLGADGLVSAESVSILAPMLRQGLPLTVATARSPATVVQLLQALPIALPSRADDGHYPVRFARTPHYRHTVPFRTKRCRHVPRASPRRRRGAGLQRKGRAALCLLQRDMLPL